MELMIEGLVGNPTAEKVLLYLHNYGEGYGTQIAKTFDISLNQVQKQLDRLENGGIFVSRLVGRTRVYSWNPRYPFVKPIRSLLEEVISSLPKAEVKKYYRQRMRPRKKGKPL